MSSRMRELIFTAVENVNNKLVLDGLPSELERFVPLLDIQCLAGDYGVYFFGQCLWDSDNHARLVEETSSDALEKHLEKRISDIRRVLNHVTSSIDPAY